MSRRHHGRSHHDASVTADGGRRVAGMSPSPLGAPVVDATRAAGPAPRPIGHGEPGARPSGEPQGRPEPSRSGADGPDQANRQAAEGTTPTNGVQATSIVPTTTGNERPAATAPLEETPRHEADNQSQVPRPGNQAGPGGPERNAQCTAPQLRRFIKSRPYVPMHELRRRFGINGGDDDVTPVRLDPGWVYVGLPLHEGSLLGDLLRTGEIGYELSFDPRTPIVIGVYPMRPIPRG